MGLQLSLSTRLSHYHKGSVGVLVPSQLGKFDSAQTSPDITLSANEWTATKSAASANWRSASVLGGKSTGLVRIEFEIEVVNSVAHILFGMTNDPGGIKDNLLTNSGAGFYVRVTGGQGAGSGGVNVNQAKEPTYTGVNGSVIGLDFNFDVGAAWSSHDGTYGPSANPATGANPFATWTPGATWFPAVSIIEATGNSVTVHTSLSTQAHAPPSGFVTWDGV